MTTVTMPRIRTAPRLVARTLALGLLLAGELIGAQGPSGGPRIDPGPAPALSFEAYLERHVRRLGRHYLVEGDIRRGSLEEVAEDYLRFVGGTRSKALLDLENGLDDNHDVDRKLNLSYCFGHLFRDSIYWGAKTPEELMAEFHAATREWERAADVNFIHLAHLDGVDTSPTSHGRCRPDVEDVYFRVELNEPGGVAGSAFLGNEDDPAERYLTFGMSFIASASIYRTMLHELGHLLGLRHEHERVDQDGGLGQELCPDGASDESRPLTPVDASSVMFYEDCDGVGSQSGHLSDLDRLGVGYLYNLPRSQKISYDPIAPTDIFWYRPGHPIYEVWYGLPQMTISPIAFHQQTLCYVGNGPCARRPMPRKALPFPVSDYGVHDTSVMLYGRGPVEDAILRPAPGWPPFARKKKVVNGHYAPVVAKLHGIAAAFNNPDDILWYSTDDGPSVVWHATDPDGESSIGQIHPAVARPLVGAFSGPDAWDHPVDVFWFASNTTTSTLFHTRGGLDPHGASAYKVDVGKCGLSPGREVIPLVGEFDGDDEDEVLWYGPGEEPDVLWLSVALCEEEDQRVKVTIEGEYKPFVGDFDGNGLDDVFFYSQGPATDVLWSFIGDGEYVDDIQTVNGDYSPFPGDFNGDGCTDILWFAPHQATSPLWRSYCVTGLFIPDPAVPHPTGAYPVGYGPGHGRQPSR